MFDSWPWWAYLLLGVVLGAALFALLAYYTLKKVMGQLIPTGLLPGTPGTSGTPETPEAPTIESFLASLNTLKTVDDTIHHFKVKRHGIREQLVWEIPGFLKPEECDELLKAPADSPAAERFSRLVKKVTGVPREYQEGPVLMQYSKGGDQELHTDPADSTIFVYLTDGGPKGAEGATEFPSMGLTIQPEKGKAVFFYNLDGEKPAPDSAYRHLAPLTFDKWIATIWVHKNPPPAPVKDADTPL